MDNRGNSIQTTANKIGRLINLPLGEPSNVILSDINLTSHNQLIRVHTGIGPVVVQLPRVTVTDIGKPTRVALIGGPSDVTIRPSVGLTIDGEPDYTLTTARDHVCLAPLSLSDWHTFDFDSTDLEAEVTRLAVSGVLLSGVVAGHTTSIAQLNTELTTLSGVVQSGMVFEGRTDIWDDTPAYSSTVFVAQSDPLTTAIGKIDAQLPYLLGTPHDTITSDHVLTAHTAYVPVDTSAGQVIVTLPEITTGDIGKPTAICKIAGSNILYVTTHAGETVEGATWLTLYNTTTCFVQLVPITTSKWQVLSGTPRWFQIFDAPLSTAAAGLSSATFAAVHTDVTNVAASVPVPGQYEITVTFSALISDYGHFRLKVGTSSPVYYPSGANGFTFSDCTGDEYNCYTFKVVAGLTETHYFTLEYKQSGMGTISFDNVSNIQITGVRV